MAFDAAGAAAFLREARHRHRQLTRLPENLVPGSEAEGVAAQHALARLLGADPPPGFKIGATARVMQDYLGLAGPAAGFMPASGLHRSGAVLAYRDFTAPGAECELAVRLARDLPPGPCTEAAATGAVGEVFAAIEIVENRYADLREFGTPALIADQVFHAAALLGASAADFRALDLGGIEGRITVDGVEKGHGRGGDLLGHPMRALAWLAGSGVAAAFGGLRRDQVVMLGSVTPPIWLDGPCEVTVAFPPLAPVTLRLTG